jgi:hypothetical protein
MSLMNCFALADEFKILTASAAAGVLYVVCHLPSL